MPGERRRGAPEPELALASAVVRVIGPDGTVGGAGFVVAPDLVLTCAHVVSDALGLPREAAPDVEAQVIVELPLADSDRNACRGTAEVWRWVPIRADQSGDVAVLRLRAALPGARPLPMVDAESVWDHETRVVGFTDDHPDGIWHRGRFRGRTGRGWVQLSRADGQASHIKRGFSGSPVWDDDLGAAVGMVVAAQPVREAQQAFVMRTKTLAREIPELGDVLVPATPFRGLATFQEADAEVFFGRDDEATQVVTALRGTEPSVILYGPSGCGKSSLALAGVVPRMRRAGYDVLVVDAGRITSPRAAIATELFETVRAGWPDSGWVDSADQVERWLCELGITDTFHRATGRSAARLLVVLDQAEALLNRSESEIAETVALLFPHRQPTNLRVLATLRADFMDSALSHEHLGSVLRRGVTLPLTPMTRDQLHQVVTEPLGRIPVVEYDPGLERRILDDAGGEPGVLPLLGFVLARLWDRRAAGRLRAETYNDLGGVTGALRLHAEQAWRECVSAETEVEARRLLTGLVRLLPGGEAPLRRVLTREEAGEERWRLALAFAERRLLVLSGADGRPESAELAHEALVTAWPALAEQVRADAEFLAGRAEVQHDLERWRRADSSADLLPGALQLAALETRLRGREADLTGEQRHFLAQAHRRRRAQRVRVRAGWTAAGLVLALVVGLGTFLVQESKVRAQREAEGRSRALAVQSDELTGTNPGAAVLAALAGYGIAPTQEARSALMRGYLELKDAAWTLTGAEGNIAAAATSADAAVTLVTTESGRATLFVRTAEGRVRQEQLRLADNALSPAVSRDGRRIAYLRDADGVIAWHDVTPTGEQLAGPAHPLQGALEERSLGATHIMDFSPEARRLVAVPAADSKRPGQVWDLETGQPRTLPAQVSGLTNVWFGPNEETLVAHRAGAGQASMATVDIYSGTVRDLAGAVDYSGNAVSADGSVAVVCRQEGTAPDSIGAAHYQAVRVADGQVLSRYRRGDDTSCREVAVDARGERFAVLVRTGEWDLVDATTAPDGAVRFFGPDSLERIAHLPLLGTAHEPVVVTRNDSMVTGWALVKDTGDVAYSPPKLLGDGSTMVVRVGKDGDRLRIMETEGAQRTIAEVVSDARTPPDAKQPLQVNNAETLVADVSDHHRISVRALPSLRQVAEFTTAAPPVDADGKPELLQFLFHSDERLVTQSGTRVEYWDARAWRRLAPSIDLRELGLTSGADQPTYFVGRHSLPGHAAVTVTGEPEVYAINLLTGEEAKEHRVRLGNDLLVAVPLGDPRYLVVMTTGRMVELWSVHRGRPSQRVAGPLGPLRENRWVAGGTGGAGFFLANRNSIRLLQADDPGYRETYVFAEDEGFLAATKGGTSVLYSPPVGGRLKLLRLDPALWQGHLCAVVGRELTDDEREGFSRGLPTRICPS